MSFTTIHFDASDYCGADFDARRVKLWATNNAEDETIHDPDGHVYIGSGNGTIAADGQASITVPVPETGWNPVTCQTTLHLDYPDRNSRNRNGRETVTFGPFTVPEGSNAGLITNVALTSNVASLTTSAAHGLSVGYTVTVSGYGAPFDGEHVITEVTSTVTFDCVIVAADVASTAAAALFLSSDIQLGDLVEEQEIPAVYLTTVTAALDAKVTEAEAAASAAAASAAEAQSIVTADLDTATAVLVPDVGTATGAALAATIEAGAESVVNADMIRPNYHRFLRVGPGRTYTTISAAVTAAWANGGGVANDGTASGSNYNQGARHRGGRPALYRTLILIDPGTYTETANLEIGSGVDLEGLGATPQDVVIYNNTSNYNIRVTGSVYLKNLTLHHDQGPVGNNYCFHGSATGGVPFFTVICDSVEFRDTNTGSNYSAGYDIGSGHHAVFYRCKFNEPTNIHDNPTVSFYEHGVDLPSTVVFLDCEGPATAFVANLSNRQNGSVWRIGCRDQSGAALSDTVAPNNTAAVPTSARPPLPIAGMTDGERACYLPTLAKREPRLLVPNFPDLAPFDPVDGRTYYIPLPPQPFSFIVDKVRIRVTTAGGTVVAGAYSATTYDSTPSVEPRDTLGIPTPVAATLGEMTFDISSTGWQTMFVMIGWRLFLAVKAQAGVQLLGSTMLSTIEKCYYLDDAGTALAGFPAGLTEVPAGTAVPYAALVTA